SASVTVLLPTLAVGARRCAWRMPVSRRPILALAPLSPPFSHSTQSITPTEPCSEPAVVAPAQLLRLAVKTKSPAKTLTMKKKDSLLLANKPPLMMKVAEVWENAVTEPVIAGVLPPDFIAGPVHPAAADTASPPPVSPAP